MPRRPKAPSGTRARHCRPRLEPLEDRCLPSSTTPGPVLNLGGVSANTAAYSQTDVLVQFRPGATPAALPGTSLGSALGLVPGLYQVNLAGLGVTQAVAAYQADPAVLQAGPDYQLTTAAVPNDPQFGQQWSLQNTGQQGGTAGADIRVTGAWNTTTDSPNVIVAVMDSGIDYTNADLYQNIWINQAEIPASRLKNLVDVDHDGSISMRDLNNPVNWGPYKIQPGADGHVNAGQLLAPMVLDTQGHDTGQGGWAYPGNTQDGDTAHPNDFVGWNFVDNTNNPYDGFGHGTAVAGIIGATGNDNVGIAGIDWNVQMMPVEFIGGNGSGTVSAFIAGLNYAVAHGAQISNNSWDGAANDPFLELAISNAQSAGDIFVAAAGNNGSNNDTNPDYPASFPLDNIVSVAATDNQDKLAGFSNYGPHSVSLAAPGVGILSTQPGGSYTALSGTSMATPEVTAVLALVWGQHPSWNYHQVINQVLSTVDPLPSLAGKVISGGRLDAAAAVGASSSAPSVVAANASGPAYNTLNQVALTFSTAMNPATLTPADVTLTGASGQSVAVQSVAAVAGTNNTVFNVQFATQTAPGGYTLQVSSAARDASGNALQAYQSAFSILPTYTFSTNAPTAIPAGTQGIAVSPITVNQDIAIADVAVHLDVRYPADGDLLIHLQAPDGTDAILAGRRGGSGANFSGTTFDSHATTPIMSGQAPFTGSFRSDVPLTALNNKDGKGTWKLWVENLGGSASGSLLDWSLTFTAAPLSSLPPPPTPPSPPPPPPALPARVLSSVGRGPSYNTLGDVLLAFSTSMDPTTLKPAAVTLTGPSGQAIPVQAVTAVTGTNNTVFDVQFATQTTPGSYTLQVSSAARDASGNTLQPYQNSFPLSPTYTFSTNAPTAIPSGTQGIAVSAIAVNQDIAIADVAVHLDVRYPADGDLLIHVQAPDGTDIILSGRRGGSGSGFSGTTFDGHAATPIMSGQAPFTGTFRPDVTLAALNGKDAKGTWKLWVENLGGSSSGSLLDWSLTFTAAPPGTAQPAAIDDVFSSNAAMAELRDDYVQSGTPGVRPA